jgi:hypothetical protein
MRPVWFHGRPNRHGRKAVKMVLKRGLKRVLRPFVGRRISPELVVEIKNAISSYIEITELI